MDDSYIMQHLFVLIVKLMDYYQLLNIFLQGQAQPEVVGKFIEVMSGGNNERPELQAAIKLCRKTNASLVVSNVSRLSRDVCYREGRSRLRRGEEPF